MAQNQEKTVVCFGEIMLRLKAPGKEILFQTPSLITSWGGSESNVAISLANFGFKARYLTALPKNQIGDACLEFLQSKKVDASQIVRAGDRMGIYFLEEGAGPRPSKVVYDRSNSSIATLKTDADFWDSAVSGTQWLHISGITPALSERAANSTLLAVQRGKCHGLTVSFDLNYRKALWKWGKSAADVLPEILRHVDILIANEEDIQNSLGIQTGQKIGGTEIETEHYYALAQKVFTLYPNLRKIAITLRESYSADENGWSAILFEKDQSIALISQYYRIKNIVDRVGAGDSFAAGLIYALLESYPSQKAVDFAAAASALKHTIPGDINRVSLQDVFNLMKGDSHGRVQR